VADKSSQLVLNALTRAAADSAGVPLHGNKAAPGLFPTTTLGKQTAQRCCDEGYLRWVDTERVPAQESSRGRTTAAATAPLCTITDKGLAFLLSQVSPKQVLEDFVRVLEARETQVMQLLGMARQMLSNIETVRSTIAPVLDRVRNTISFTPSSAAEPLPTRCESNGDLKELFHEFCQDKPAPAAAADPTRIFLTHLERWAGATASEDCPLPDLFRAARAADANLTIGAFHDALRGAQDCGHIYLHPWTGPLYEIPEPPLALLIGHEVAYYASLRKEE
jgi:hypothetical protein